MCEGLGGGGLKGRGNRGGLRAGVHAFLVGMVDLDRFESCGALVVRAG